MVPSTLICETDPWKDLKAHVGDIKKTRLRELMSDADRCQSMMVKFDGILLDYSRQCATLDTLNKLHNLAEAAHLKEKINRMFNGERFLSWIKYFPRGESWWKETLKMGTNNEAFEDTEGKSNDRANPESKSGSLETPTSESYSEK